MLKENETHLLPSEPRCSSLLSIKKPGRVSPLLLKKPDSSSPAPGGRQVAVTAFLQTSRLRLHSE